MRMNLNRSLSRSFTVGDNVRSLYISPEISLTFLGKSSREHRGFSPVIRPKPENLSRFNGFLINLPNRRNRSLNSYVNKDASLTYL